MTSNMAIWDANRTPDPAFTKRVQQRGGFTALGTYYMFELATRQFGPVGLGWGWEEAHPPYWSADGYVVVSVRLWWRCEEGEQHFLGPIYASNQWRSDKGRVDEDALKKAVSDAVTKSLSMLGFAADVFLGRFDDNKYVQQAARQAEFKLRTEAEEAAKSVAEEHATKAADLLARAQTPDQLRSLVSWCRERAAS